eukprot:GHVU01207464.1.p1 GENE.GHVU01207464.1~~GHVU01207464.1.p1  ORF type:complete len:111 (+),score=3.25 GHVU01207464.1:235-567(+)
MNRGTNEAALECGTSVTMSASGNRVTQTAPQTPSLLAHPLTHSPTHSLTHSPAHSLAQPYSTLRTNTKGQNPLTPSHTVSLLPSLAHDENEIRQVTTVYVLIYKRVDPPI